MTDSNVPRRRFLQATGAAATVAAVAGCTGDGGDGGTDEPTTTGPTDTTEPPDTDTPDTPDGTDTTEPPDETTAPPYEDYWPTQHPDEQVDRRYKSSNSTATSLDPIELTDEASIIFAGQIHDCLTNYIDGTTSTENLLIEGFETNDAGDVYTFNLKQGVQYNTETLDVDDYGEVTAQDVRYSWRRLAESPNSGRASYINGVLGVEHDTDDEGNIVPDTLAVEAIDDYTVEVSLQQPFHAVIPFLAYEIYSVIPEGIVGDIEGYSGDMDQATFASETTVGCGAYMLETWESETQFSATAIDKSDYHYEGPFNSGLHYQIIEDTNATYTYHTVNTNADTPSIPNERYDPDKVTIEDTDDLGRKYGTYGPIEDLQGKLQDPTVPYHQVQEVVTYYFGLHQTATDKFVRQALAHVVNQQEIANQIISGPSLPAVHLTPPAIFPGGVSGYEEHAQQYPYGATSTNLDQARALMEDQGYDQSNPYELDFAIYGGGGVFTTIARLIRDQAAAAHINASLRQVNFAQLLEVGRNGNLQAYSLGWGMDYPAPDNFLQLMVPEFTDTSPGSSTISYTDWDDSGTQASQKATDAWEKIKNNPLPDDPEHQQARNEAYLAIEEANWEDVNFINLFHLISTPMKYPWLKSPMIGAAGGASIKKSKYYVDRRTDYMQ